MGFAVLHMSKTRGSYTGTSGHIERKVQPENADASRKHLNRELVQFPEGVNDRTHAIQYRLKNAGIKRKIAKNQVTVIRINLGGSNEDMKRIEQEGRLDDWANDSFGKNRKKIIPQEKHRYCQSVCRRCNDPQQDGGLPDHLCRESGKIRLTARHQRLRSSTQDHAGVLPRTLSSTTNSERRHRAERVAEVRY